MKKTALSNAERFLIPPFVLFAMLKTYQTPLVFAGIQWVG